MSKEIRTFPNDMVAFNEKLLDAMQSQRVLLDKVRAAWQFEVEALSEFDLVRQQLGAVDRAVKGFTTDMHNHLIRLVGLQAHFQDLLAEPLKKYVGLHVNDKKRKPIATAASSSSSTSSNEGLHRAQSTMSYDESPSPLDSTSSYLILYSDMRT